MRKKGVVISGRHALLTTDIQALVLGIKKARSSCKMAAGDTTVGVYPLLAERRNLVDLRPPQKLIASNQSS